MFGIAHHTRSPQLHEATRSRMVPGVHPLLASAFVADRTFDERTDNLASQYDCLDADSVPAHTGELGKAARSILKRHAAAEDAPPPPSPLLPLLVLPSAYVLAAAMLIIEEHAPLLAALERLVACGCADGVRSLSEVLMAGLLQLELAEHGSVSDLSALEAAPRSWTYVSWPDGPDGLALVTRGQCVLARRLRPEPRMAYLRGFLSAAECAHIIRLGIDGGAMHPSRVVNHHPSKTNNFDGGVQVGARTSESCRVSANQDMVVRRAVQRAAFLVGVTPDHAEAVQVVHYLSSQQYRPHYDYFNPEDERYEQRCGVQGNRLVSVFAYLSGCDGGGKTYFPKLREGFAPEAGCAVCWYNIDRHGNLDERTLHAGQPVESGEKWGLNVWLRERPRLRRQQRPPRAVRATLTPVRIDSTATEPLAQQNGMAHIRLQLSAVPPPPQLPGVVRCDQCGHSAGPIGLCLCRHKYVV